MSSNISSISGMSNQTGQMNAATMRKMQDDMFNKIDSNGDGGIDKAEFSDLAKKLSEVTGKSLKADDAFSKYDKNGDGTLSKDELGTFMKDNAPAPPKGMGGKGGPPSGGANKSGAPAGGAQSGSSKSYDKKDTNKDGIVSALEELAYDLKNPGEKMVEQATKSYSASMQSGSKSDSQGLAGSLLSSTV